MSLCAGWPSWGCWWVGLQRGGGVPAHVGPGAACVDLAAQGGERPPSRDTTPSSVGGGGGSSKVGPARAQHADRREGRGRPRRRALLLLSPVARATSGEASLTTSAPVTCSQHPAQHCQLTGLATRQPAAMSQCGAFPGRQTPWTARPAQRWQRFHCLVVACTRRPAQAVAPGVEPRSRRCRPSAGQAGPTVSDSPTPPLNQARV